MSFTRSKHKRGCAKEQTPKLLCQPKTLFIQFTSLHKSHMHARVQQLGHPVHTNLHTNLLHSVHARARSTATRGRERWLHVLEDPSSYPSMCAEPCGPRRSCTVRVLLKGLRVHHLREHLRRRTCTVPYCTSTCTGMSTVYLYEFSVFFQDLAVHTGTY